MNPYEPPASIEEPAKSALISRLTRSKELHGYNLVLNLWNSYVFYGSWIGTLCFAIAAFSTYGLVFNDWFKNVD